MAIRVALNHRTSYRYDRPIALGPQTVRLRPAPHTTATVVSYSQKIRPAQHFINWQQDPQANHLARLVFPEKTQRLEVEIDLLVDLSTTNPFDFFLEPEAEIWPFEYSASLRSQLAPCLGTTVDDPRFLELAAGLRTEGEKTVDLLVRANEAVNERLDYLVRLEPGVQRPAETLEIGSGSCRDFAWLLTHLCRSLGFAARFVSGYSIQLRPDVKPLEGPTGVEQDTVDLHAWCEVYLPGAGWVGLDATSGLLCDQGHIPLACAPDPEAASPIEGALEPCESEIDFEVSVRRIDEAPRSTRPFSDRLWNEVLELGKAVDERLRDGDVRLTMGGEPTFVSSDDFVGEEWTVDAVGPDKLARSEDLIRRLRDRFSPGAVLLYGQGKWYPGESLPRWSLSCVSRRDDAPIWRDLQWLATPATEESSSHSEIRGEDFGRELARELGVEDDRLVPAYEDVGYYLWKEQRLPVDVDPLSADLEDPEERARLARVFGRGLGEPAGWVLPLQATGTGEDRVWQSGLWMLRGKRLVLAPGDSPVGLRLPMSSLPVGGAPSPLAQLPPDPFEPRGPLPRRRQLLRRRRAVEPRLQSRSEQQVPDDEPADDSVRTALAIEESNGRLEVFLPPLPQVEDFLDLVASVEAVASRLKTPVVLSGYPPPDDARLEVFKVTPDPGVVEVNVSPCATWAELVELTEGLFEEARQSRLQAVKYLVDGREVGTGGGNHLVLGGAAPADSPFLRRPDLLRSLITYVLNHPSLSYLFSSLFIGPTSQAPRIDEARTDSVRELELAFEQFPAAGEAVPFWKVDRLLRDLLVDSSGNTHRSEICIDKLYSPDSAAGRLGLVEIRSFEMTPHARMSLVQQLLLRALIVRFWEDPYAERPQRWGASLHDRFLLPAFLRADFEAVLRDLREHELDFQWSYFEPQFEFRCPLVGRFDYDGLELELRRALEPWHVLGEEPGGGGTVRFVDSSLERLEVSVRGLSSSRFAVACNGWRLPLEPCGDCHVAGVRFRAWQPSRCLQPDVPVQTPLTFDLVDLEAGRAVHGCTYHVGHPGGRNYEEPPVNALEAESRRQASFEARGHTPGPFTLAEATHPGVRELSCTLDLRWAQIAG
ncbi:MAG: transglutaminase family protein [Acidobacteriota bacterium]